MKHVTGIVMMIGSVLMGLSIGLPIAQSSKIDIIGGADFPVFLFFFRETFWMLVVGTLLVVVSMVIRHKK